MGGAPTRADARREVARHNERWRSGGHGTSAAHERAGEVCHSGHAHSDPGRSGVEGIRDLTHFECPSHVDVRRHSRHL
eukprot:4931339-Alexandrium_andersonii.AAC.1